MKTLFVAILPILTIVAVVLVVVFFGPLRRHTWIAGNAPRPWHPVVRMACGAIASVLAGAVIVGSWGATAPPSAESKLRLLMPPASAEADISGQDKNNLARPDQVIYTVIAAAVNDSSVITPLDAQSLIVDLSSQRDWDKGHTTENKLPGGSFKANAFMYGHERQPGKRWAFDGYESIAYSLPDFSDSRIGNFLEILENNVATQWIASDPRASLSIIPDWFGGNIVIVRYVVPVIDGEPREVTVEEWVADITKRLHETGELPWSHRPQQRQPNGIEMLRYTGPASALLLAASILAAQCFPRRGVAFAGSLVVAVLLAVTLDRIMVERHAAWLVENPGDTSRRASVIARMENSFFHAGRAHELLAAMPAPR